MPRQITCITKPGGHHNEHEHITHVGGPGYYITRQQCADDIRFVRESYYVHVGQYTIGVEAYERNGTWFIRTTPDATRKDNLLNLPECRR